MAPVDHHNSSKSTKREGEALNPAAGRDIERPRGGVKGPLLGMALLGLFVIIAIIATYSV